MFVFTSKLIHRCNSMPSAKQTHCLEFDPAVNRYLTVVARLLCLPISAYHWVYKYPGFWLHIYDIESDVNLWHIKKSRSNAQIYRLLSKHLWLWSHSLIGLQLQWVQFCSSCLSKDLEEYQIQMGGYWKSPTLLPNKPC